MSYGLVQLAVLGHWVWILTIVNLKSVHSFPILWPKIDYNLCVRLAPARPFLKAERVSCRRVTVTVLHFLPSILPCRNADFCHDTEGDPSSFPNPSPRLSFLISISASPFGQRVTSSSVGIGCMDCGTFACYRLENELLGNMANLQSSVLSHFPMLPHVRTGIGFTCTPHACFVVGMFSC